MSRANSIRLSKVSAMFLTSRSAIKSLLNVVVIVMFTPSNIKHLWCTCDFATTNRPSQVLLLETGVDNYCKVLYNGEYWYAEEKDIYGEAV